jgi:hypothetical protein
MRLLQNQIIGGKACEQMLDMTSGRIILFANRILADYQKTD